MLTYFTGNVKLQEDGLVVHIQHLIFSKEIDDYKKRMDKFNISEEDYMEFVFRAKIAKVSNALLTHFEITKDRRRHWAVMFHHDLNIDEEPDIDGSPSALPRMNSVVSYTASDGVMSTGRNSIAGRNSIVGRGSTAIPARNTGGFGNWRETRETVESSMEESVESGEQKVADELMKMYPGTTTTTLRGGVAVPAGDVNIARLLITMKEDLAQMRRTQESQQRQNRRFNTQLDHLSTLIQNDGNEPSPGPPGTADAVEMVAVNTEQNKETSFLPVDVRQSVTLTLQERSREEMEGDLDNVLNDLF